MKSRAEAASGTQARYAGTTSEATTRNDILMQHLAIQNHSNEPIISVLSDMYDYVVIVGQILEYILGRFLSAVV